MTKPKSISNKDMRPEQERFLELFESHRRLVLKVCWAYSHGSHDRDDLFQEIVARLWAAFPSYDHERSFSTWMYRVALNVAIDSLRRQKRRRESSLPEVETADPAQDVNRSEQMEELHELLDQLEDADRAILILHLEERSYREIGEILGITESNVGTRLSRLKKSLRQSAHAQTEGTNHES